MRPTLAIATLVVCLLLVSESKAQNCWGGGFQAGLPYHGFGYSGSLYGLGYIPVPPYFSLHPPVYYGQRVYRSYGDSPYAYAPRRPAPQPKRQVVLNPYTSPTQQTSQQPAAKVAAAKMQTNPFYSAGEQHVSVPEVQINPYVSSRVELGEGGLGPPCQSSPSFACGKAESSILPRVSRPFPGSHLGTHCFSDSAATFAKALQTAIGSGSVTYLALFSSTDANFLLGGVPMRVLRCSLLLSLVFGWQLAGVVAGAERPNFVLLFCDNLGYGDVGCFGSTKHRTPHIDRMAAEGLRLTSFYSASGVCTPSRAALMTGCYPRRVGLHQTDPDGAVLRPVSPNGLHPRETTIAEILKAQGYATACIGKWHLGDQPEFLPTRQGFDAYFGIPYSDDMTLAPGRTGRHCP